MITEFNRIFEELKSDEPEVAVLLDAFRSAYLAEKLAKNKTAKRANIALKIDAKKRGGIYSLVADMVLHTKNHLGSVSNYPQEYQELLNTDESERKRHDDLIHAQQNAFLRILNTLRARAKG